MSGIDRYALGGHSFTHASGSQQQREPQQQALGQTYDVYRVSQERRDNYWREVEHLVAPKLEWALADNTAAVDLAQSALKTSILINVGGFVAIQAAVPLFKLDAAVIQWPLLRTGICFATGLAIAWIAHGIGFHSLSSDADQASMDADAITYMLLGQYHPADPKGPEWAALRIKAENQAYRLGRSYLILRLIGILMFWLSVVLFLADAGEGVCTIVGALPPPAHPADAWPFMICRPR